VIGEPREGVAPPPTGTGSATVADGVASPPGSGRRVQARPTVVAAVRGGRHDRCVHTLRLDRRRLLQAGAAGAAGAATLTFADSGDFLGGTAQAAPLTPQLRRSTWLGLTSPELELLAGERAIPLRLTGVEDLPIAARIAALRGHDGAFSVGFSGPAGIAAGTHTLRHPQLGAFQLFVAPVARDGATRAYEAVVDRTIRIAGVNEEGQPIVADPGGRAQQPAGSPLAPPRDPADAAGARRAVAPRLSGVRLVRGVARRVVVADVTLADAGQIVSVRAGLRAADGRVLARASAAVRGSRRAKLRFAAKHGTTFARGRHELVLTLVARDGRVTRIRRGVHVG
jgi:hypothetical protein